MHFPNSNWEYKNYLEMAHALYIPLSYPLNALSVL